jgi:hypothetical protein
MIGDYSKSDFIIVFDIIPRSNTWLIIVDTFCSIRINAELIWLLVEANTYEEVISRLSPLRLLGKCPCVATEPYNNTITYVHMCVILL